MGSLPEKFEIVPTYVSSSGTGRTCKNVQGWLLHRRDGRLVFCGESWNATKRAARDEAVKHFEEAHGDGVALADHRVGYVEWLLGVWPEASGALAARRTQRERAQVRAAALRAEEAPAAAAALESAAPEMLSALQALDRVWRMENQPGKQEALDRVRAQARAAIESASPG